MRCRVSSNSAPSNWAEGIVTSYTGNSLAINVDHFNGSGTFSDWNLNVAGLIGAGYQATSTSAASIATGPVTVTTQANLAYSNGARVRMAASSAPTNFIEGLCTSYSGTALTINVDLIMGSGAFTAWTINLTGQQGPELAIIDGGIF
jgi:hypothetical protein